jgi:hypothetical protein
LEQRVLHRVRSEGKRFWLWVPVFAAAMVALFLVTPGEQVLVPMVDRPAAVRQEPGPREEVRAAVPVVKERVVRRRGMVSPKKDVFPSPMGLTEGERALLRLMQQHPEAAFMAVSKSSLEPIEIPLLEICPIEAESGQ